MNVSTVFKHYAIVKKLTNACIEAWDRDLDNLELERRRFMRKLRKTRLEMQEITNQAEAEKENTDVCRVLKGQFFILKRKMDAIKNAIHRVCILQNEIRDAKMKVIQNLNKCCDGALKYTQVIQEKLLANLISGIPGES